METTIIDSTYRSNHACNNTSDHCYVCLVEQRATSSRNFERCVEEVLKIYGNVCYLCQKPIDLDAPRRIYDGEGLGLQLDHVLPISKGGKEDIFNIRPTHSICNLLKKDKPLMTVPDKYKKEDM